MSYAGDVKLADFGIAKILGTTTPPRAGCSRASSRYMSPEQVDGEPATHRSDLFSLGVVMWELAHRAAPVSRPTRRCAR
jgi:serine/threonine protein kinase